MKILSVTRNEGRVVELTQGEWAQFRILSNALEGKTLSDMSMDYMYRGTEISAAYTDVDFSGVFGAVQAFYEANFKLNELKQLVGKFDEYMKVKKD
jgi:hypothetical protein